MALHPMSVNAHAEELRSHFVQHEGQKHLVVRASGNRYSVDFGRLAEQMTGLIDEHVRRDSLHLDLDASLKTLITSSTTKT